MTARKAELVISLLVEAKLVHRQSPLVHTHLVHAAMEKAWREASSTHTICASDEERNWISMDGLQATDVCKGATAYADAVQVVAG